MAQVAAFSAAANVMLGAMDDKTRRATKKAVRAVLANPDSGYWIGEKNGFVIRMSPFDGWRLYYTVWEGEITVVEILRASQAPSFPT